MILKLTKQNIAALKPPASGHIYARDTLVQNFALRLPASGKGTWCVDLRVRGGEEYPHHKISRADRMTLDEARSIAKQWLVECDMGVDPVAKIKAKEAAEAVQKAVSAVTVSRLRELFLIDMKPRLRPSTFEQYSRLTDRVCDVLGDKTARELTTIDVQDYFADRRAKGLGQEESRKQLIMFSQFCRWSCRTYHKEAKGNYLDADPTASIARPKKPKPRRRALSDQEIVAYWKACSDLDWPFGPLFKLLLLCGTRCGETVKARWSAIDDTDKMIWTIPADDAKNEREHHVYLAPLTRSILASIPRFAACDLVFSLNGRTPATAFPYNKRKIVKAMGFGPQWQLHDMRRTITTGLARLGVAPHVADRILNHKVGVQSQTALIYDVFEYMDQRREALTLWADYIEKLVGANVVPLVA